VPLRHETIYAYILNHLNVGFTSHVVGISNVAFYGIKRPVHVIVIV